MPTILAKRKKDNITIGSCKVYLTDWDGSTLPSRETICVEANRLGYVKGGASLEYTQETLTEKDDLGYVSKTITTSEEAKVKFGIITWNGNTLHTLVDRSSVSEADGIRTLKIGGGGNAQDKNYVLCLHHEDNTYGDVWVMIVGKNTAGATITLATDKGTVIEPEFTAMPHDSNGTLIEIYEEIGGTEQVQQGSGDSGNSGNDSGTTSP
jgi:hypothetical protein